MELLLVPLGWAVALHAGGASGFGPGGPSRRGPHHPPGNPMPPGAHRHHRPPLDKLTKDTQLMHDTAHIQEDLGRPLEDMSNEELEFHYFKLHDFDNNTLLDGLEMLKAIYHTMDHDHHESQTNEDGQRWQEQKPFTPTDEEMNRYIELIDKVFDEDDLDHDGFLSYPEFVLGRASGRTIELAPNKVQIKPAGIAMEV